MGVSGCGKTTVGKLLSKPTGWNFYDADDFHPPENIEKMSQRIRLTDGDRQPWLHTLKNLIDDIIAQNNHGIIACSALKSFYREILHGEHQNIHWVYLQGDYLVILERIKKRKNHFMKPEMLRSQFDDLEEPTNALTLSILLPLEDIVNQILAHLNLL